jgi:hypothetical protein
MGDLTGELKQRRIIAAQTLFNCVRKKKAAMCGLGQ